jgi:hypothetical protein
VNVERLCEGCGKPLPLSARADRRYHEPCRAAAYRQRKRERRAAERVAMERAVVEHAGPDYPEVLAAAIAEPRLVVLMAHAARQGSWRAAAWLLERQFPERWGPPERRLAAAPADAATRAPDAFSEVDELAARRRRRPD